MSYTSFEESDDALSGSQNLEVLRAEAIRDWEIVDGTKGQIVEVTLFNPNPAHKHDDRSTWVTDTVSIELIGDGFTTVRPGEVHRLMPGDQVTVRIIIQPTKEPNLSALDRSSVRYAGDQSRDAPVTIEGSLVYDWTLYTEDVADLEQHRSPAWFNGAKFGVSYRDRQGFQPAHFHRSSYIGDCTRCLHGRMKGGMRSGTGTGSTVTKEVVSLIHRLSKSGFV